MRNKKILNFSDIFNYQHTYFLYNYPIFDLTKISSHNANSPLFLFFTFRESPYHRANKVSYHLETDVVTDEQCLLSGGGSWECFKGVLQIKLKNQVNLRAVILLREELFNIPDFALRRASRARTPRDGKVMPMWNYLEDAMGFFLHRDFKELLVCVQTDTTFTVHDDVDIRPASVRRDEGVQNPYQSNSSSIVGV